LSDWILMAKLNSEVTKAGAFTEPVLCSEEKPRCSREIHAHMELFAPGFWTILIIARWPSRDRARNITYWAWIRKLRPEKSHFLRPNFFFVMTIPGDLNPSMQPFEALDESIALFLIAAVFWILRILMTDYLRLFIFDYRVFSLRFGWILLFDIRRSWRCSPRLVFDRLTWDDLFWIPFSSEL
jgi:hypothetical protein